MAHGIPTVLCRYYMHGVCREAESCRFSHNLRDSAPSQVCRYYLKGQCSYGDRCRFDHVRRNRHSSSPATTPSTSQTTKPLRPKPILTSMTSLMTSSSPQPIRNEGRSRQQHCAMVEPPNSLPSSPSSCSSLSYRDDWAAAAEFIPGRPYKARGPSQFTYSEMTQKGLPPMVSYDLTQLVPEQPAEKSNEMCPYAMMGTCRYGENCLYVHGDICDMCGQPCLHPEDPGQRQQHQEECVVDHEKEMELAFAIQESQQKTCGICMDLVWEKKPKERMFGILSDCTHVFCLSCIRKWRSAKQFENRVVRACPECRVRSNFVTPSPLWVEEDDKKKGLIEGYKNALSKKPCKHFDQGKGTCPFGSGCFYLHTYPDGRKEERKERHIADSQGRSRIMDQISLWNFIEGRNHRGRSSDIDLISWDSDDDLIYLYLARVDLHSDSEDSTDTR